MKTKTKKPIILQYESIKTNVSATVKDGTIFRLSDLYSSIECSHVEIFSLEPLKKVGSFKTAK